MDIKKAEIKVEERDSKIWQLVPKEPKLEQLATGFGFTEGPVWCGDHLLFSDIPQNHIMLWRMSGQGSEITIFRNPSGNSNGLTRDKSGRLLACEHGNRRVSRTEKNASVSAIAERYKGQRLNSPNDVVVRSDGTIYFTDPPYGLENHTVGKETPFNGVYRIKPDGELVLLFDDFDRPNGLAFSPDEKTLYVDDSTRCHIRAFDVDRAGNLSKGRVFVDIKSPEEGVPDGMKVDRQGNVYCTGPGGLWVIDPAGKPLGRIVLPEVPANVAWGDSDWKTLYITARTSIYRLRLTVPGIPVA